MQYLLWPLSEQFQNKNGSILTNGKVYVYYRGRTALATTWSDEDGTVENPQPIILDDNGRAACYVNPAYYYTVVVCDFYGKELFSYDISLHDGVGTGDNNIEITSSDHSILIDKTSIIDGYRYDEKVNPEFVAEVAVSAVSDLIPDYINEDRTIVIKDRSEYDTKTKLVSTDMQSVMIRQQINNSSSTYKYAKICEADIGTLTWINEWMTTLQLSFQSNGAYYNGKSSGIFVLNCENYLTQSGYSQRHEEDGKWLLFDKDTSSPQISKLYLYWRDDFSSQHYELWGEFNSLKYYEGVGVAALINCSLRNHLTSSLPIDQERNIWRFNPIGIETVKDALPTDAGDLVKTFDPADADIKPMPEPEAGTFYATYVYNGPASGNTSFEDIKAAYDSGKSVYVNYKQDLSDYETEVYFLVSFRDTPAGRPDLSCFFFTNLDQGTEKTIYRFPSNWGKMTDRNLALSDNLWDLTQSIAQDDFLVPIPSPSGVYCTRNYEVYKAIEPITSNTWVASAWTKVTVMDEVLSLVSSTSGTTDVFIAKYMVTPVSSVFEAVDEGKFVWVSLGSDGHGPFLPMNVTSTEVGGTKTNYVRFEGLYFYDYGGGNAGRQVLVTAANSEGWEGVSTTNIAPKEFVLSTVSGASSILESEIQVVSAAIDSASGGNFLAIYQSTPASAIYDALDAGKNVMVSLNADGSGNYFRTNSYTKGASYSDSRAYFIGTLSFGQNNVTQGRVYLDGETWSPVEYTPLPSTDAVGSMISNTVSTVSSVLETEIQTVSSALDAISGQNGVFIAEYGTTTFEEIGEAVADGKAVFGKGHPYNSDMLLPIASFTSPRPSIAIFSGIIGNYQYSIKLDGTTWSNDTITLAKNEDVVNADWDATSGRAEILNRPEIEPVSAGTGIEIVEVSGTMVISATGAGTLTGVTTDSSLMGDGTPESPLGLQSPIDLSAPQNNMIATYGTFGAHIKNTSTGEGTGINDEGIFFENGQNTEVFGYDDVVRLKEVSAQVNADWEATSGVAEILNKPTLTPVSGGTGIEIVKADGKIVISATGSTVPVSGVFFAEYGVTTTQEILDAISEGKEVIAYTTDVDDGTIYAYLHHTRPRFAFLRTSTFYEERWYNVGDTWSREVSYYKPPVSGGIETVQYYNRYYLQAKVDGTSIGINSSGALESLVDGLPISTSSDEGKVLTVDSNGEANWYGSVDNWDEAYNVVNASAQIWNEAAAMDEYPVSAGPGISIEEVSGVTVFSTSGVMMEADLAYNGQGEISGYNGSPIMTVDSEKQWLTHDDTIAHVTNSAQYAFGVNVPVVAQAMGTDETQLFSNSSNVSACTLSEDIQNFNRFKIGVRTNSGEEIFEFMTGSNGTSYDIVTGKGNNQGVISICQFTVSGTSITAVRSEGIVFTWGSNPSYRHNEDMSFIQHVYGVGRKENT